MVRQILIFYFFFILTGVVGAQDERYYRQILSGELSKSSENIKDTIISPINAFGGLYRIDLNSDGIEETIQPQKRDGVDWIEVRDASQRKLFEAKLLAMGAESVLYKVRLVSLSQKVRAIILYLDEGFTKGRHFESTAKVYLISFENNDLSTMSITDGAHFFHEKKAQREQYLRRTYNVNVHDIDGDGVKEISVQYNSIQRIFRYKTNGEWEKI